MEKAIQTTQLFWQPQGTARPILNSITTEFEPGHFYGILGANGSGKTSLLKHLLGLLSSEKAVILEDVPIEKWTRKELAKKLSYVPQNTVCEADYTVEEFVMLGRFPHQGRFELVREEDREKIAEALKLTNCEELRFRSVRYLSGGEMQRVVAARAIAQDTPWMFLDEPVSQLDIRHQIELMDIMREICQKKRTTIVAVLHDINLALRYCDRFVLMKQGNIIYSGLAEETVTASNLSEIYGLAFEELFSESGQRYMIPMHDIK